mgnify:CR=1 FL=1
MSDSCWNFVGIMWESCGNHLGIVWEASDDWEVGFFGRDLLEPYHIETMFPGIDVEPARVERTFLISIYKKF